MHSSGDKKTSISRTISSDSLSAKSDDVGRMGVGGDSSFIRPDDILIVVESEFEFFSERRHSRN